MRYLTLGFILCSLFFIQYSVFFTTPTYAHILKTDGSIGATLHIDPDDDPIAGQTANFFFDLKDKQDKFKPELCNCTFTVVEDDKQISSQNLTSIPGSNTLTAAFTFPEKNVYTIKVNGTPTTPNTFQEFSLVYDVRVARDSTDTKTDSLITSNSWISTHIPHVIGGVIVGLFLIFALIKQIMSKPKPV